MQKVALGQSQFRLLLWGDSYGIDRALRVELPWLAKWSHSGMARGSSTLVPQGTVGVFDRHDQLKGLSDEARARLRAVILSHDNDPIAVLGPELIVQRPPWLANGRRGRGVPEGMRWIPLVTFVQTAMDAANATASTSSCGPWTQHGHAAPQPPAHRAAGVDAPAGVPLRTRRTGGARWFRGRREAHPPPTPTG